ncbi:MAG TPA: hypothetical protein VLX31_01210 [Streptosporangiaceae bacterium]|nr:hypothetical protein [Streptosporangiaceae bacterium]
MTSAAEDAAEGAFSRLTSGRWAALAWLSLAVAAWVAGGQVSSIVAEVTPTGQYSAAELFGVGQLGSLTVPPYDTLRAWAQASGHFRLLPAWLWWYLGLDGVFLVGLLMLGIALLRRYVARRRELWPLYALVAGFAAEAALAAAALAAGPGGWQDALAWALHAVTIAKWLAVLVLAGWLAVRLHASHADYKDAVAPLQAGRAAGELPAPLAAANDPQGMYADVRRVAIALEVQRFSALVVVLLGLIAIGPALNDVFQQVPDVARAMLSNWSAEGVGQLLIALVAQALLALLVFHLGRMRERRAEAKFGAAQAGREDGRLGHQYRVWYVLPAVIAGLAVVLRLLGWASVAWQRVIAFSVILLAVAGLSLLIERRDGSYRAGRPGRPKPLAEPRVVDVTRQAGEVMAVMALVVLPVGLVRALTVPALVGGDLGPLVALIAGLALATAVPIALPVCWPTLCRLARPVDHLIDRASGRPARRARRKASSHLAGRTEVIWLLAVPFAVADVALIALPLAATRVLGVLGTTVIGMGTLTVLLGVLAYLGQTRLPLPAFRALRLNVTPVITIVLLIAIIDGVADSNSALHQLRPVAASSVPARPTLAASLARWLGAFRARPRCALAAGTADGHPVRVLPLVQVAANGGGIRAAWWTVKVLSDLARSPCGTADVFAVSSVSGGSVGAAVLASVPAGTRHPVALANAGIAAMAGPDALAAASDGLMLRDAIAGYTGIELRAVTVPGGPAFPDRAALMTLAWQREYPPIGRRFLGGGWLGWDLLFNATSVTSGCRAILATVALPRSRPVGPGGALCGLGTASPTGSYDFFTRLHCMDGMSAATAAMLSARYAFITPSATVEWCPPRSGRLADQIVDGGYGEGTGLSTLIDLAPAVMAQVRQFNARALRGAGRGAPVTLVVPVTVYLQNSVQSEPVTRPAARTPEIRAVTAGQSAGPATELTGTTALLQAMLVATGQAQWLDCTGAVPFCAAAARAAAARVPDPAIIVAPRESPGVATPLGWLLSPASRADLDQALAADDAGLPCGRYLDARSYRAAHPFCLPSVGGLADLRALIGR